MAALPGFTSVVGDDLIWLPERRFGYYPVKAGAAPYDKEYFAKYAALENTFRGRQITHARADLVERHESHVDYIIDVGIGCGAFIKERLRRKYIGQSFGYDINPEGVEWLRTRSLYLDPYKIEVPALTLWDVMEHIPDYPALLARIRVNGFAFMSLPIFENAAHARRSRHFRPTEHCWYFTVEGLIGEMERLGFSFVESNTYETLLGREDIGTFAFRKERRV